MALLEGNSIKLMRSEVNLDIPDLNSCIWPVPSNAVFSQGNQILNRPKYTNNKQTRLDSTIITAKKNFITLTLTKRGQSNLLHCLKMGNIIPVVQTVKQDANFWKQTDKELP